MRAIVLFLCNKCTVLNHDCLHFLLESSFTIINYCVSLIFINLFHNRTASLGAIDVSQCVVCKSKVKSLKTMKCRHTFCLECFKNRLMISYKEGIINLKYYFYINNCFLSFRVKPIDNYKKHFSKSLFFIFNFTSSNNA